LLRPVVQPIREQLHETARDPALRDVAAQEHRALVECILAGDAAGARGVMAAHLARVVDEIAQVAREELPV
jgi:DNA-binding FadR family transcriptional regulator